MRTVPGQLSLLPLLASPPRETEILSNTGSQRVWEHPSFPGMCGFISGIVDVSHTIYL